MAAVGCRTSEAAAAVVRSRAAPEAEEPEDLVVAGTWEFAAVPCKGQAADDSVGLARAGPREADRKVEVAGLDRRPKGTPKAAVGGREPHAKGVRQPV